MPSVKRTLRPRLMMAGAFVGALLALSLSWSFSWSEPSDAPSEQERARDAAFHAAPGQCLDWKKQNAQDAHVVSCSQPHVFEVSSVQNLSGRFPPGAQPPSLEKWRQLSDRLCDRNIEKYLDEPLDPHGKYSLTVLRPTTAEWQDGERKVRCGLQRTDPAGDVISTTGYAAKQPQSSVFEPGTCLDLVDKSVGGPVACSEPHAYEIIATLDLTTEFEFTDGHPSAEDQNTWLDKKCNEALKDYTGGTDISEKGLMLGWDVVQEKSWNAGSTRVNCKVGETLEDGSGLAAVTGSVAEGAEKSTTSSAPTSTSKGG